MDTFSHGLWGAAAALALGRRVPVNKGQVIGAAALGIFPDVAQALPVAFWAATQPDAISSFLGFVFATPATEIPIPRGVRLMSHHIHCAGHSVIFVAVATLLAWRMQRALLVPLAGWWLHIALDIPTHSHSYYAVPFLYPLTYWGFDGVAWTTPWVLVANYVALLTAYVILGWKYYSIPQTTGSSNTPHSES